MARNRSRARLTAGSKAASIWWIAAAAGRARPSSQSKSFAAKSSKQGSPSLARRAAVFAIPEQPKGARTLTLKIDLRGMETNPKSSKIVFRFSDILSTPEWPEGSLVEIVKGDLFLVPSPSVKHQRISKRLYELFASYLKDNLVGEMFYAPVDVILSETDVVIPDLFFVSKENDRIVQKENMRGAPDIAIEILSISPDRDKIVKKAIYEQYIVKEYWIVDPDAESVDVFTLDPRMASMGRGSFIVEAASPNRKY